jgi:hypothetical protein
MKKSNLAVMSENQERKPVHTEITVGMAHTIRGEGTHIFMRPDGKYNPLDPDSDLAILIS